MNQRRYHALTLAALLLASGVARAQEPAPAEGESSGRVFDGYFATGILAGLVLFLFTLVINTLAGVVVSRSPMRPAKMETWRWLACRRKKPIC